MLHSARPHDRWARWTLVAQPGISVQRDNLPSLPNEIGGGWIGILSYELGHQLEPAAGPAHPSTWPALEFIRIDHGFLHDAQTGSWSVIGKPSRSLRDHLARPADRREFELEPLKAAIPADHCLDAVARTIEYIRAGDIFQANITQPLEGAMHGCPRALAACAFQHAQPWYGAYLELDDHRIVLSLSPELFLHHDASTRRLTTRPIKGTRPATIPSAELERSAKDRAELTMIVDLMRNDLGRVCEIGTVRVDDPRTIETHPTVHHGVATVSGMVQHGAAFNDVIRATFPAGSVTGAPKIRAMQIIRKLESSARGPYCGSIGWIGDDGGFTFNVAIRTLVLTRAGSDSWQVRYGVGGGIVADSDPARELEECHAKAAVLRQLTTQVQSREAQARPLSRHAF